MSHFISFVRIPALAIRQHIRPLPRIHVLAEDTLALRVWPNDIDFNLHMNNARYLSAMDYGRMHLLARGGLLEHILRWRWQPLVGAVWVTYRRSLPLFARFHLTSRIVCWDERWFYLEQIFTVRGPERGADGGHPRADTGGAQASSATAAIGWVKGALRGADGILDPRRVIESIAPGIKSPPLPEAIAAWNDLTREQMQSGS